MVFATDVLTMIGYVLPLVLVAGIAAIMALRERDRRRGDAGDDEPQG